MIQQSVSLRKKRLLHSNSMFRCQWLLVGCYYLLFMIIFHYFTCIFTKCNAVRCNTWLDFYIHHWLFFLHPLSTIHHPLPPLIDFPYSNLSFVQPLYLPPQWCLPYSVTTSHPFKVDQAYGEDVTNEDIYYRLVQPLVHFALTGGHSTCFAYGQTGSGKTFTMMGHSSGAIGLYAMAVYEIFRYVFMMVFRVLHRFIYLPLPSCFP